jgi:hypothetical protein
VRERLDEIRAAGAGVLVVTQSRPEAVAGVSLPLPTVCDPDRAAYRYFGLDRGRWSMFLRGRVLARYLRLIVAGWRPHRGEAVEDMLQLGGDFILSADRRLLYAHRSNDPADRPAVTDLVEQVRHLTRPPAVRCDRCGTRTRATSAPPMPSCERTRPSSPASSYNSDSSLPRGSPATARTWSRQP